MKITLLGHACFLIETSSGTRVITDPYTPGAYEGQLAYGPIGLSADVVTISHDHADHNASGQVPHSRLVSSEDRVQVRDVTVEGIRSYHDTFQGKKRGTTMIFIIAADGLRLIHCGDLGTTDVDVTRLQKPDILCIPVGGTFTLDADGAGEVCRKLAPVITIPMHYKTPRLAFSIDGAEKFLRGKTCQMLESLDVSKETLRTFSPIVQLMYRR